SPAPGPTGRARGRGSARSLRERGLEPGDLRRVPVRVFGIDLEPAFAVVAAALGMPAELPPVRLGHHVQELRRGLARGPERQQRRLDRARLVVEPPRPLRLVVSLDHRVGLGEELPQARRALRLAVRQVVDDLGGGPLAGERSRRQLARRKSLERLHDLGVAGLVLRDERVARVRVHVGLLSHTGALAHPGSFEAASVITGTKRAAPYPGVDHKFSWTGLDVRWNLRDPSEMVTPYILTGLGFGRTQDLDLNLVSRRGSPSAGAGVLMSVRGRQR